MTMAEIHNQTDKTVEVFFLNRTVRLLQPEKGFRTSFDSVMMAAACPVTPGQRVLDMGCGVGGASLCLLQRMPECHVSGLDIQAEYVALAARNAVLNERADSTDYFESDICDYGVNTPDERYDHVICNPPYLENGAHLVSPNKGKAIASGHLDHAVSIDTWVKKAHNLLKSGGSITFIHRADMLDHLILAFGKRFGKIEVIPLWPKSGVQSKRVIVRGVKDRRSPLILHAGMVVHNADGSYTDQADRILRDGQSIDDVLGL